MLLQKSCFVHIHNTLRQHTHRRI